MCSMTSINNRKLDDSNPDSRYPRDSPPMPEEILCSSMSSLNSNKYDDSLSGSKDSQASSPMPEEFLCYINNINDRTWKIFIPQ